MSFLIGLGTMPKPSNAESFSFEPLLRPVVWKKAT
jgi:hypothetical protein